MARAFAWHEPWGDWAMPDPTDREERIYERFRWDLLERFIPYGECWTIGAGTAIWHFCHVLPGASIGANCIIGQNVMVGRGVRIGNGCKIQNNVSVYENVELQDDVFCGPSCVFTNVTVSYTHLTLPTNREV